MKIRNNKIEIEFKGIIVDKELNHYNSLENNYEHTIVIKLDEETVIKLEQNLNDIYDSFEFIDDDFVMDGFELETEDNVGCLIFEDSILLYKTTTSPI